MGLDVRLDVGLMLKGSHHREEIACGWISVRPHYSHQALFRNVRLLAQRTEADGRVDAIAQEDEASRNFALEERL